MSSIQGIQGVGRSAASYVTERPQAVAAAKPEVKESAQDEQNEIMRGTQEAGESKPSFGVGSRVNLTA